MFLDTIQYSSNNLILFLLCCVFSSIHSARGPTSSAFCMSASLQWQAVCLSLWTHVCQAFILDSSFLRRASPTRTHTQLVILLSLHKIWLLWDLQCSSNSLGPRISPVSSIWSLLLWPLHSNPPVWIYRTLSKKTLWDRYKLRSFIPRHSVSVSETCHSLYTGSLSHRLSGGSVWSYFSEPYVCISF